jgi:hypothetical protein
MLPMVSRFWRRAFGGSYRFLGVVDPLIRAAWVRWGLGNVVELRLVARRSGRPRSLMLGLLRAGDDLYLGHPNGETSWTRDLDAAQSAQLVLHGLPPLDVRAHLLPDGLERTGVIRATGQHPFPGNLAYRLARRHVLAVGRYYRLEPIDGHESGHGTPQDAAEDRPASRMAMVAGRHC